VKALRVLMVGASSNFPLYAGGDVRVLELSRNLANLGLDVHILVAGKVSRKKDLESLILHELDLRPGVLYFPTLPKQLKAARSIVREEGIEIVHGHMLWGGLLSLAIKSITNVPNVFDPHDWFFSHFYGIPLALDVPERILAMMSDVTLLTGQTLKSYVIMKGVKMRKLFCVPNGVREEFLSFRPSKQLIARAEELVGGASFRIIFVGALLWYMGLDVLIRAFSMFLDRKYCSEAALVIVGSGPERDRLKSLAKKLGIVDNVIFTGSLKLEMLISMLDIADVAVIPFVKNLYTSFIQPIKLLEYMARSKPVVASNLPGVAEIVNHGVDGLLVRPGDPVALADALALLAQDEEFRAKLGRHGREVVERNYTWRASAKKLKAIYEIVLERELGGRVGRVHRLQ